MRKVLLGALALLIIIIGIALIFNRKDTSQESFNTTNTSETDTAEVTTTSPPPTASPSGMTTVNIKNMAYVSKTITVKANTKVTWTNQDAAAHTVTFDDTSLMNVGSGTMQQGDTYEYTFTHAGSFTYHCGFHPNMTGKVIVTE